MNPDDYYGDKARNYDKLRSHKSFWKKENAFVEKYLTKGPVIDIPVGTGRYIDIYKKKGFEFVGLDVSEDMLAVAREKFPDAPLHLGNVFDIKYADDSFGTAVCSRLMHWLYPEDMQRAMQQICRVSDDVIVSVRLGKEGIEPGLKTYTHDEAKFIAAAGNKIIDSRETIRGDGDSLFQLFKFRNLDRTADFHNQLASYHNGIKSIPRLAKVWCRRFNIPDVDPTNAKLTIEVWDAGKFRKVLRRLQGLASRERSIHDIITDLEPRRQNQPPVYFKSKGNYGLLDGRRRSNKYSREDGIHQVIVIDCDS